MAMTVALGTAGTTGATAAGTATSRHTRTNAAAGASGPSPTIQWLGTVKYQNTADVTDANEPPDPGHTTTTSHHTMTFDVAGPSTVDGGGSDIPATTASATFDDTNDGTTSFECADPFEGSQHTETWHSTSHADGPLPDPGYISNLALGLRSDGDLDYQLSVGALGGDRSLEFTITEHRDITECGGPTHTEEATVNEVSRGWTQDADVFVFSGVTSATDPHIVVDSDLPHPWGGRTHWTVDLVGNPCPAAVGTSQPTSSSTPTTDSSSAASSAALATPACSPPLTADAGGPYNTTRAVRTTLDASKTRGPAPISEYRWTFAPGVDCPANTKLTSTNRIVTSSTVEIVALCDLTATLRVTDAQGATATAATTINVLRRTGGTFNPTKVDLVDGGTTATRAPRGEIVTTGFILGRNDSRCRSDHDERVLCPRTENQLDTDAYVTRPVSDPGGPFDGFEYIGLNRTSVKRIAMFNRNMFPGSPHTYPDPRKKGHRITWRAFNLRAKTPVAELIQYVREHEGWGKGGSPTNPNRSGHAGAMQVALRTAPDANDPALVLEALFAGQRTDLVQAADRELRRVDRTLTAASIDPLQKVWQGRLRFWNPNKHLWATCTLSVGVFTCKP